MGIFDTLIVRPFGLLLMWIYNMVDNYGVAIIIFAAIAKLLLLPFSYKSKKSMAKMSKLQEKLNKLQKQYANNRVKLNEEITKLYEREGVSPMSGCLPSFLPLPIMFGLYYAVQKPLTYMMGFLESGPDIGLLANAVGIDLAAENAYTVQIVIAERLGEFFDAAGNLMPQIANLSSNIANYLVYIDFNFFRPESRRAAYLFPAFRTVDHPDSFRPDGFPFFVPDTKNAGYADSGLDEDHALRDAADVGLFRFYPARIRWYLLDYQ